MIGIICIQKLTNIGMNQKAEFKCSNIISFDQLFM